jgi:hypothetical protein
LPAEVTLASDAGLAALHHAIPWDLPVLACGIHLLIVAALFRWSERASGDTERLPSVPRVPPRARLALEAAAILIALLLPVIVTLYPRLPSLAGKKIVFYEKGFLNWLKPTHDSYGRLSSGMYGMLPGF